MSLAFLQALSGCASKGNGITIHPLEKDFRAVKKGETLTAEKDSYLVSEYWLEEVAGLQVDPDTEFSR